MSKCETLTNCTACIDAKCYWCGANRVCQESSVAAQPAPCGYNGESCGYYNTNSSLSASCWKDDVSQCPGKTRGRAIEFASSLLLLLLFFAASLILFFSSSNVICADVSECDLQSESFPDCKSCAGQTNCKWCSAAQACSEISYGIKT